MQVIIPGAAFDCHGYITNWTALLANYFYRYPVPNNLQAEIFFQLWRPVGNGQYMRVDDDLVEVTSLEVEESDEVGVTNVPGVVQYLEFSGRVGTDASRMFFEPGDVLGYFASGFIGATYGADVTFKRPSPSDAGVQTVDMYYFNTSTRDTQLCQMSICGDEVNVVSNVVPQLKVAYGKQSWMNWLLISYK